MFTGAILSKFLLSLQSILIFFSNHLFTFWGKCSKPFQNITHLKMNLAIVVNHDKENLR